MYREEVRFDRLPNEAGGDPTLPMRRVVGFAYCGSKYESASPPCSVFIGFTNVIRQTPDGQQHAITIIFKIEAPTFEKAFEAFDAASGAASEKYVQDRIKEEQDIQRRRKIVVANEVPAGAREIHKAIEGIR